MVIDALFNITQAIYFITNFAYDSLYVKKANNIKKEKPEKYKKIHSFIPVYDEPKHILRTNIKSQLDSDYPKDLIHIYPIAEETDTKTVYHIKQISKEFQNIHPVIIPKNGEGDWPDIIKEWSKNEKSGIQTTGSYDLPYGKGRALSYAYYTNRHVIKDEDIITVFDAEDIIEPDLFNYGVSGLEQGFGVVQGKIKYRNNNTNLLTALESMEPITWSNLIYNHTSHKSVPWQVLGPAYFFDASLPEKIGGWSPFTTSEDVEFGLRCWENGAKLGILDVYTSELGVKDLSSWFKQRRRWIRGHQKVFLDKRIKGIKNNYYFYTYTLNSQLTSANTLIAAPVGFYVLYQSLLGAVHVDPFIGALSIFNLLNWAYSSVKVYKDSKMSFGSKKDKIKHYLKVNPVTVIIYNALWTIPLLLAIKDCIDSKNGKKIIWEKTNHDGYEEVA